MTFLSFPFTVVTNKIPFFETEKSQNEQHFDLITQSSNSTLWGVFLSCSKPDWGVWDLCKGCSAGHCQRKRIVFNNNSHFSPLYLPLPCKCLKNLWFCSGEDNGTFSFIMKTPPFSLDLTFPTMLCSEDLGSVQMCQQRSWFSQGLVYTSLETTLLIPFSSSYCSAQHDPGQNYRGGKSTRRAGRRSVWCHKKETIITSTRHSLVAWKSVEVLTMHI